jgi:hypothetical protein
MMARERPDCPVIQQERRNRMLPSRLEFPQGPTAPARRDRREAIQEIPDRRIPANYLTKGKDTKQ